MKIDRHNYEEFFILYLDNELNAEERRLVEEFAKQHEDLREEFDILVQSRMMPDEELVFGDKDALFKSEGFSPINKHNYEEWFLSYADNELNPGQRREVENFIANHPVLQNEMNLLVKARMEPDTIAFPYKEALYRHEEKARVVAFAWKRYAAAAALLLAVSSTAFILYNKEKETVAPAFATKTPETKPTIQQLPPARIEDEVKEIAPAIAKVEEPKQVQKQIENKSKPAPKQIKPEENKELANLTPKNADKIEIKEDNNLPRPRYNSNILPNDEALIAYNDANGNKPSLTQPKQTEVKMPVTPEATPALYASTSDEVPEPGGNKNKLRGFFRKLTRTFEKNTNIKATDDEDRLLVGGLAIRL